MPKGLKRAVSALLITFLVYCLLGFLLIPGIGLRVANQQLAQYATVPARLERIEFNPFSLELTLWGLRLGDENNPQLAFRRLYANLQLDSLWKRQLHLADVELEGPHTELLFDEKGQLNLASLFRIRRANRPSLNSRATRSRCASTASNWPRDLTLVPITSRGHLSVKDIQLKAWWPYVRDNAPLVLENGVVSLSSDYRLDLSKDTQLLLDKAALKLADFSINSPQGKPLAKLASLDVAATTLDLAKQEVVLGEVRSQGLEAWAARERTASSTGRNCSPTSLRRHARRLPQAGGKHRSAAAPTDAAKTTREPATDGAAKAAVIASGDAGRTGRRRRTPASPRRKGNGRQRVRQGRGRRCRQGSQARDEQGSEDRQGNRAGNGQDCGNRQGGQRLSATARRHCKDASAGKYESRRGDARQALAHRPARRPAARLQGAPGGSPAGHRGPAGSRPAGPRPAERRQPRQDPFDLKLKTGLGNHGQVQASGQVVLDPVSARLKVSTRDIDLRVAQAYISPFIRLELRSGFLGSELAVDLKSVEPLAFSVDGSAEVSQLHTLDTIRTATSSNGPS